MPVPDVYDGEMATVTGAAQDGGLAIAVTSRGETCATGQGWLPATVMPLQRIADFAHREPPARRPNADGSTLAEGTALAIRPLRLTPNYAAKCLQDLREIDPIYERRARPPRPHPAHHELGADPQPDARPADPCRQQVQQLGVGAVGESLAARARVATNYERKGHRVVPANGTRPAAHIRNTVIYRPRPAG